MSDDTTPSVPEPTPGKFGADPHWSAAGKPTINKPGDCVIGKKPAIWVLTAEGARCSGHLP